MYIWPFSLITSFILLILGIFVFLKNRFSVVNASFCVFATSVFTWLFFYSLAYFVNNDRLTEIFFKLGYMGVVFIPVAWLDFTFAFLNINKGKLRLSIRILYATSIVFLILNLATNDFIVGLNKYSWGPYPKVNPSLHIPFLFLFVALFSISITCLLFAFLNIKKNQTLQVQANRIKYVFWSTVIGPFAAIDFLPNYGVDIWPIGFVFMFSFSCITAVSIVKYRLLNISLIITRTTVFIAVYSLVLGIPFALAIIGQDFLKGYLGNNWWVIPLGASTILATIGPSIYLSIQRKAEDRLLQEQRQYQATLRKASLGMGQIKDLQRLLNLIVHIVTRAVRIEHCKIYLYHESSNKYILKAQKGKNKRLKEGIIDANSGLIKSLVKNKEPIVYNEIRQKSRDYNNTYFQEIELDLQNLDAEIVVPSFIENKLIALIVLGKKRSGKFYSQDDLVVFSILASQAALAIENAMFYEETKRTHEQLFKAEKMATIGTMADGLSHQINNRLHAMGFIAGDAVDTLKRYKGKKLDKETQKLLDDMKEALGRIEENVKRGGEIVQGLLAYTRKGEEGFVPVDLTKLLDASIEMVGYKIKTKELEFHRDFDPKKTPRIKGNFTQLQEVLFNIIDNAYDAIHQRKEELSEPGYKGVIHIDAHMNGLNKLELVVNDNGIGVKDENKKKIFTPFFTTKLSSKKGTGLGMYVIKQIIEENHRGKVEFTSEYKKGSQTKILLPIYEADLNKS